MVNYTHPDSKEATDLLKKFLPIMSAAGSTVPRSNFERKKCEADMRAMIRSLGSPSLFLTMAVDDVNDMNVLRMTYPVRDNNAFPATTDLRGDEGPA